MIPANVIVLNVVFVPQFWVINTTFLTYEKQIKTKNQLKVKKIVILLILTLGWLKLDAQQKVTGQPCAKLDQQRGITGMQEILNQDGEYAKNLRTAYADAINTGIGERLVGNTKDWMIYILKNTVFVDASFVVPSDYYNGVKYGDTVSYTNLLGQPSDKWAAFTYLGKQYIYAKVSCMNPQKVKVAGIFSEPKKPNTTTVTTTHNNGWSPVYHPAFTPRDTTPPVIFPHKIVKKSKWWIGPVVGVAAVGVGYGAYELFHKAPASTPTGGPGGAPSTTNGGSDTGGPGGAPPTTGFINHQLGLNKAISMGFNSRGGLSVGFSARF
jgi:hypothetical protein